MPERLSSSVERAVRARKRSKKRQKKKERKKKRNKRKNRYNIRRRDPSIDDKVIRLYDVSRLPILSRIRSPKSFFIVEIGGKKRRVIALIHCAGVTRWDDPRRAALDKKRASPSRRAIN